MRQQIALISLLIIVAVLFSGCMRPDSPPCTNCCDRFCTYNYTYNITPTCLQNASYPPQSCSLYSYDKAICESFTGCYYENVTTIVNYTKTCLNFTNFTHIDLNQTIYYPNTSGYYNYIDFNTSYVDGVTEGRLQWNTNDNTLELGLAGGVVNLQIGQEQLLRATNNETVTIKNCQVVYLSGATGNNPKVMLSTAANYRQAQGTVGMATQDINSGQKGYITTMGLVHDCDTSAWTAGTALYLSTNKGNLTSSIPVSPNATVFIGIVIKSHATTGIIWVDPVVTAVVGDLSDVYTPTSSKVTGSVLNWNNATQRYELTNNLNVNSINTTDGATIQGNLSVEHKITAKSINVTNQIYSSGNLIITGNMSVKRPYATFSDNTTQTTTASTVANPVNFSTVDDAYLVSITNRQNISFSLSGDYLLEISALFSSTSGTNTYADIWLQKNGVNVPRSNTRITIPSAGTDAVVAVPFIIDMLPTDSLRFMWSGSTANVRMLYITNQTAPVRPETPSILLTITKVSEVTS